jgi:predicted DNA-binding mobile mystery protein A
MQGYERDNLRRELDDVLLPFRLVGKQKGIGTRRGRMGRGVTGWVKSIRQAIGMPVDELARRLGVCRWEVHRLEQSEKNSRIMLSTLSRAAEGLGCELVYALTPKKGTLEELATEQRRVREELRIEREMEREAKKKPWLEAIGWREKLLGNLRTILRKEGFRVRPRKTERGVAKQQAEFKETMKLAGMARVMGPLMSELASEEAGKPAGERAEE